MIVKVQIDMVVNTGTYIDTPFHCYADGYDVSALELDRVAAVPGVVVDVPPTGATDDPVFAGHDLSGRAVLLRSGWSRHFGTDRYGDPCVRHSRVDQPMPPAPGGGDSWGGRSGHSLRAMTDGGWRPDPTGRHEFRWWQDNGWTEIVADGGVEQTDPMWGGAPVQPAVQMPTPGHTPAGGRSAGDGGNRQAYTVLAILGIPLVAVIVVVAIMFSGGGGDDDDGGGGGGDNRPPARDALIQQADLPTGWSESDGPTVAPREELICDARPTPTDPPAESDVAFDRMDPSGAVSHRITEHVDTESAAAVLDEAERQADSCGTFDDEGTSGGEDWAFTATATLVTGPTIGDQTVWYSIEVHYTAPQESEHEVLVCLDRHGSVISGFTLSTAPPTSSEDRAMVEALAQAAADRLGSNAP